MPDIAVHDWFRPKLTALIAEAAAAGYPRDVAEAVITDLMNGALAAAVPPPDEAWALDAGEPADAASEMPLHSSVDTGRFDTGRVLEETKVPFGNSY